MADVWSVQMGGGGTLVHFHDDHFWGGGTWSTSMMTTSGGIPWSTSMMTTSGGGTLVNFHDDHFRGGTLVHFHDDHFWGGYPGQLPWCPWWPLPGGPMWPIPQCSSCYLCSPDTKMMGLAWCTCLYSVAPKNCGNVTWDPLRVGQIDRQTRVNALPSRILRMRSVIKLVCSLMLNYWDAINPKQTDKANCNKKPCDDTGQVHHHQSTIMNASWELPL